MNKKVISHKYLPTRPVSVFTLAAVITMLHYWQAPGWVCGVIGAVTALFTIFSWVLCLTEKSVAPSEVEAGK